MNEMLRVSGLSKKFRETDAVSDLSFTVNQGDVYGFLGQNGAGKSTTLRMLLKLIRPTLGTIEFFGKNIQHDHNAMLRQTGAIIERPDLYKYLSAYDNLYIFAKMSGIKAGRQVIMKQLEMVGLDERAKSKVKDFSQGMKQRLGIAIALIHEPKLVILDEPTNGLDPQGIADMRNMILQLSNEMGKTVIVSSHLLNEIEMVANRMIIIHKGKKMVEGKVAELLDPAKTLVKIETTDNPLSRNKLLQSEWAGAIDQKEEGIMLSLDKKDIPDLAASLARMDIGLLSLQPSHSLEDYFLSLTNHEKNA
jgi:ABC-type multidrug transport system ATPase subunit